MSYPYMIGDNDHNYYRKAFDSSLKRLASRDPVQVAENSGAFFDARNSVFTLQSLGQWIDVTFPAGEIYFSGTGYRPLWSWRLVILNYLGRADNTPLSRRLISYRETDGGHIFFPAFQRESIKPLVDKLCNKPGGRIKETCARLTARFEGGADVSAVFDFLPRFPVTVKIWLEDEELRGSANILFDAAANHYLHTEDIAVAANLLTYFLIKQYGLMFDYV